jgi:hypothetical protein
MTQKVTKICIGSARVIRFGNWEGVYSTIGVAGSVSRATQESPTTILFLLSSYPWLHVPTSSKEQYCLANPAKILEPAIVFLRRSLV